MNVSAGEVWDIEHTRKGSFTARFLEAVADGQEWVNLEIAEGKARFLSLDNRISGAGETGETITSRVSFLTLKQRRSDLEAA